METEREEAPTAVLCPDYQGLRFKPYNPEKENQL